VTTVIGKLNLHMEEVKKITEIINVGKENQESTTVKEDIRVPTASAVEF